MEHDHDESSSKLEYRLHVSLVDFTDDVTCEAQVYAMDKFRSRVRSVSRAKPDY